MKIDYITNTVKKYNEDGYGITQNSLWVIDGASALNDNNYTEEENDVFYIVNWWNKYLKENIDKADKTIIEIVESGVDKLNDKFSEFVEIESLSKLDRVSLGIAITRINEDILECFVLGDVEINIRSKTKDLYHLTDTSIKLLDNEVMKLMTSDENRQDKLIFKGFTKEEWLLLQKNRNKMNTEDGYYILEHEREAIKNGILEKYNIEEIEDVLLMTDGYAQMYNTYDLKEVFEQSKEKGLKKLVEELREKEEIDNEMKSYVRLKQHDDVTAILIGFN